MSSNSHFSGWKGVHYKALSSKNAEARFLEIDQADNIDDQLVCRLVTLPLTDDLDFVAVSSLIGDLEQREQIVFNRTRQLITNHVALGLRHVRQVFYPELLSSRTITNTSDESVSAQDPARACKPARKQSNSPRWLKTLLKTFGATQRKTEPVLKLRVWIDCICMNPVNAREQARRKIFMYHIYQKAATVVGWLGPKIPQTDLGIHLIRAFDEAMPDTWQEPGDKQRNPGNYSPHHEWAKPVIHLFDPTADAAIGTADFLNRDFFHRVWILEEMAMARMPSFLIGDSIVSWRQILRLNLSMEEFKDFPSNVCPALTRPLIHEFPLHTVHQLLDEFEKRKRMDRVESLNDGNSTVREKSGGSVLARTLSRPGRFA